MAEYLELKDPGRRLPAVSALALVFGAVWVVSGLVYGGAWRTGAIPVGGALLAIGLVVGALGASGRGGSLILNRSGYLLTLPLGRKRFVEWHSVDRFVVLDTQMSQVVGVRLRSPSSGASRRLTGAAARVGAVSPFRLFRRQPVEVDDALPSTYGQSAQELVRLLEEWRLRARA